MTAPTDIEKLRELGLLPGNDGAVRNLRWWVDQQTNAASAAPLWADIDATMRFINALAAVAREQHEEAEGLLNSLKLRTEQRDAETARADKLQAEFDEFKTHHYGGGCGCDAMVPEHLARRTGASS
jgi:hypothetical protein